MIQLICLEVRAVPITGRRGTRNDTAVGKMPDSVVKNTGCAVRDRAARLENHVPQVYLRSTAWAAARRAIGTRKGEHET